MVITIDIEAVTVQSVFAHPGDTMSQLTQLPVQLFSVQPRMCGVRMVGADGIHSSCCSILFSPEQGQSAVRVEWADTGVLEQRTKQVIQNLLSEVELLGSSVPHVWGIEQVGDGEIKGERHQGWAHVCNCRARDGSWRCWRSWREGGGHWSAGGGDPVPMVVTIDIETVPVQGVVVQPSDTLGLLA